VARPSHRSRIVAIAVVALACAGCSHDELGDPKTARDCVAFLRDAHRQADFDPNAVKPPGARPRLQPLVFWFGPRLGSRRAIVVVEDRQEHVGDRPEDPVRYPAYFVSYQVPADGCQTDALPGYDPRPENWHRGREIQVNTIPLGSPEARVVVEDVDYGRLSGPLFRTADGRRARIVADYETGVAVAVADRLVTFEAPGDVGVEAAVRRLRAITR
jgi:hypothetical protein